MRAVARPARPAPRGPPGQGQAPRRGRVPRVRRTLRHAGPIRRGRTPLRRRLRRLTALGRTTSGTTHRYTAACAAALAGCGRGEGGATLGEAERARWRGQAREWLRADLAVWARTLDSGPESDRLLVRRRLAHLWADPDLAGLFDHDALDRLPPAERQECRTLWGEIDALIRRCRVLSSPVSGLSRTPDDLGPPTGAAVPFSAGNSMGWDHGSADFIEIAREPK